jgi:hypothetical protein
MSTTTEEVASDIHYQTTGEDTGHLASAVVRSRVKKKIEGS